MLKQRVFWTTLILTISNHSNAAFAQSELQTAHDLLAIVKQFYEPYVTNSDSGNPPDALLVLAKVATPHLKWLIARDEACENQTHEICWIDFDPIVGAQDYGFGGKYPKFSQKATRWGIVIMAKFGQQTAAFAPPRLDITYDFAFDGKKYLLSDVRGGPADGPYDLVRVLSGKD